jgi:hypothetical protein
MLIVIIIKKYTNQFYKIDITIILIFLVFFYLKDYNPITIMTSTLKTRENTITFVNDMNDAIKCTIKIIVETKLYEDGRIFYYITYENSDINIAHPFYKRKKLLEHLDGDIVFKNPMTENLVDMLLMNYSELSSYSGSTTPDTYRKSLMKTITLIFD